MCNRRRRYVCCCRRCCTCQNNSPVDQPQPRSGICTVTGTMRYTDVPMTTVDGLSGDSGCSCGCGSCNNGCETAIPWNGRCR